MLLEQYFDQRDQLTIPKDNTAYQRTLNQLKAVLNHPKFTKAIDKNLIRFGAVYFKPEFFLGNDYCRLRLEFPELTNYYKQERVNLTWSPYGITFSFMDYPKPPACKITYPFRGELAGFYVSPIFRKED